MTQTDCAFGESQEIKSFQSKGEIQTLSKHLLYEHSVVE